MTGLPAPLATPAGLGGRNAADRGPHPDAEGGGVATSLLWTVFGGVVIGGVTAFVVLAVAGRTEDHVVEVTLTTVIAWASFLLAEHVHASGVFAALAAGIIVGAIGPRGSISVAGRQHVQDFWAYAAFLANSCLFLLIGSHEAHQPIALVSGALVAGILLTLLGRAAAVYPLAALFAGTKLRLPATYQHALVWGELRGAVGPRAGAGGAGERGRAQRDRRPHLRRGGLLDLRPGAHHAAAAASLESDRCGGRRALIQGADEVVRACGVSSRAHLASDRDNDLERHRSLLVGGQGRAVDPLRLLSCAAEIASLLRFQTPAFRLREERLQQVVRPGTPPLTCRRLTRWRFAANSLCNCERRSGADRHCR